MMASPKDLTNFAIGFLSEAIIDSPREIYGMTLRRPVTDLKCRLIFPAVDLYIAESASSLAGRNGCGVAEQLNDIGKPVQPAAAV